MNPPIKIVAFLDASEIIQKGLSKSTKVAMQSLSHVEFTTTTLVVAEVINHYEKHLRKMRNQGGAIMGIDQLPDPGAMEHLVVAHLEECGVLIVEGSPQVNISDLFYMDMHGNRPLKDRKDKGVRDFIHWRSFLAAAAANNGRGVLLSSNTRDFQKDGKLATELIDDAKACGLDGEHLETMSLTELLEREGVFSDTQQEVSGLHEALRCWLQIVEASEMINFMDDIPPNGYGTELVVISERDMAVQYTGEADSSSIGRRVCLLLKATYDCIVIAPNTIAYRVFEHYDSMQKYDWVYLPRTIAVEWDCEGHVGDDGVIDPGLIQTNNRATVTPWPIPGGFLGATGFGRIPPERPIDTSRKF